MKTGVSILLLALAVAVGGMAADKQPIPKVKCEGTVLRFDKEGFQALMENGECAWFDVTWVKIVSPAEFAGVEFMLTSSGSRDRSPYGKDGEKVEFQTNRGSLEFWRDLEANSERMRRVLLDAAWKN